MTKNSERTPPAPTPADGGNYQATLEVPDDLLKEIRHLRARVASVLQRAESATKALAA
jgi:hypothetical protein